MVILLKRWFAIGLTVWVVVAALTVPVSAQEITITASSAILYEPTTGRVLYEKNADEPRAMASTTKLMTALIAADWCDPEQEIIVPDAATRVEGSSLGLRAGDYLTMRDLLTGLLLVSGNDAANVVALTVSDSIEQFAARMNERAAKLGMTNTRFVTPSGLDAEGHYTTARDMALLAAEVLAHPLLAEICAQKTATVHIGNPKIARTLTNHNRLLSAYEGTIGLKTGYTQKAGRCLVSAVRRNGVTLIAVTLRAPDDWNDHQRLYDYGFDQVALVDLVLPHLPLLPVGGGQASSVKVTAPMPPDQVLPIDRQDHVEVTVSLPRFVFAPITAGDTVGELVYTLDGTELCRVPITATADVEERPVVSTGERFSRRVRQLVRMILG